LGRPSTPCRPMRPARQPRRSMLRKDGCWRATRRSQASFYRVASRSDGASQGAQTTKVLMASPRKLKGRAPRSGREIRQVFRTLAGCPLSQSATWSSVPSASTSENPSSPFPTATAVSDHGYAVGSASIISPPFAVGHYRGDTIGQPAQCGERII
jgi:hypothetical protein